MEIKYRWNKFDMSNSLLEFRQSESYFRIWYEDEQKYILIPKRVVEDKELFISLVEEKTSLKFECF